MNKMKKVPEIRFKEFAEDWENTDASIIFKTYFDKNHPDLPVLSASQEYGMIIREDVGFKVQHNKENEAGYKRVLPGQFVIHLRSFQGGFAHSDVEGITSPAYTIIEFRDKSQQDDIFWKYVLTSKEFIKRLETVTYGIRDGRSISFEDFSELGFNVPDIKEQRKIGKTLTVIDTLIRKLEQKLEKLRNIKQSLLNLMFVSVNRGGYAPLIRFKGYDDEWKTNELNEVAKRYFVSNQSVHHQNLLSLSYGKIKRKNIKSKKGLLPNSFDTYQIVKDGIIVMRFTDLQNDHKSLRIGLAKEEGIVSPAYTCISVGEENSSAFLYEQLNYYDSVLKQFYKMGDGLRQTLSYKDIERLNVYIPHIEEQENIVFCNTVIETIIGKVSTKLTKLNSVKQSLLQKMFV